MTEGTHTFWSFTINNYDATDLALVTQGYPDYIREIAFTLEKGEEKGTPHIQAFVKLMRPQRLTFIRKLFPRAACCKFLDADEFKLNAKRYSVKQDGTATAPSVIINNPFQDPVSELMNVARSVLHDFLEDDVKLYNLRFKEVESPFRCVERQNVERRPTLAKFYVSAMYQKIKAEYWREFLSHIQDAEAREACVEIPMHTHTHTHSDEKFSREGDITDDAHDLSSSGDQEEGGEGEADDGSSLGFHEGTDEGSGDEDCEGSDCESE